MKNRLYIKNGIVIDILSGVDKGDGTTLYNGSEEEMLALGYEPYVESAEDEELPPWTQYEYEIQELQTELQKTDYINFKSNEGYDCDTLYPGWKEQRRAKRDRINELELLIKELKNAQL